MSNDNRDKIIIRVPNATEHLAALLDPGQSMLVDDVIREIGIRNINVLKTLMWRLRPRGIDLHIKRNHVVRHA